MKEGIDAGKTSYKKPAAAKTGVKPAVKQAKKTSATAKKTTPAKKTTAKPIEKKTTVKSTAKKGVREKKTAIKKTPVTKTASSPKTGAVKTPLASVNKDVLPVPGPVGQTRVLQRRPLINIPK